MNNESTSKSPSNGMSSCKTINRNRWEDYDWDEYCDLYGVVTSSKDEKGAFEKDGKWWKETNTVTF